MSGQDTMHLLMLDVVKAEAGDSNDAEIEALNAALGHALGMLNLDDKGRPPEVHDLILMYAVALPELDAMGGTEWSTAPEHNDPEAEWQVVAVCMGCGHISQDGDHVVTERDASRRFNEASLNVYDDSEGLDVMVNVDQTDDFYETEGYDCAGCGEPVSLPEVEGFGVDWP